MEQPTQEKPAPGSARLSIPDHQLFECIGRGSYGQVWLARNVMGSLRAIKVVWRSAFPDREPFERELKGIQKFEPISRSHPGFVHVLHVGHNPEEGYLFYVMELGDAVNSDSGKYEAKTLDKLIRAQGSLPVAQVLHLGLRIADAVHHLHHSGLVHRDIKPSNIIFFAGMPKLADIGLVTDPKNAESIVGTLGFIPPEGPGTEVADVYALGKVLYECLTGLDRSRFPELPDWIQERADRPQFLELNEIILKSCHQNPALRYKSAREMHGELAAIENGVSILRSRKLERRWDHYKRLTRIAASVITLAAVAGILISREVNLNEQERQHTLGALTASGARAMETGDYADALRHAAQAQPLLKTASDKTENRLRFASLLSQMPKLTLLLSLGADAYWCDFAPDGRSFLVAYGKGSLELRDAGQGSVVRQFEGHQDCVVTARVSRDGQYLASGSLDHTLRIWRVADGHEITRLDLDETAQSLDFTADGREVAYGTTAGWIRKWEWSAGKGPQEIGRHKDRIRRVLVGHGGAMFASCADDGVVYIWDTATGQPFGEPIRHSQAVLNVSFSPDDQRLITACNDGWAYIWSLTSRSLVAPALQHTRAVRSAEFSPDGGHILTAGWEGAAQVWTARTSTREGPLLHLASPPAHAMFAPNGRRILAVCVDGTVRLWDLAGQAIPRALDFKLLSEQGHYGARAGADFVDIYTNLASQTPSHRISVGTRIHQTFLLEQGPSLAAVAQVDASNNLRQLEVRDLLTGRLIGPPLPLESGLSHVSRIALDRASARVAFAQSNIVRIVSLPTGRLTCAPIQYPAKIGVLAFNPRRPGLAIGYGHEVQLVDPTSGASLHPPFRHELEPVKLLFSETTDWLVVCTLDRNVVPAYARVWDCATGLQVAEDLWHQDGVTCAAWLKDGQELVTVGEDGVGRFWELPSGRQLAEAIRHRHEILSVSVSADHRFILTASKDHHVRVWSSHAAHAVSPPLPFASEVQAAYYLPARGIVVDELNGPNWLLPLATPAYPEATLLELSELLNATTGAENPGDGFLKATRLAETWGRLRRQIPECFSVTSADIIAWHLMQGWYAHHSKEREVELFHCNQVLAVDPTNSKAMARKAYVLEKLSAGRSNAPVTKASAPSL